jgi:hypothetical protein
VSRSVLFVVRATRYSRPGYSYRSRSTDYGIMGVLPGTGIDSCTGVLGSGDNIFILTVPYYIIIHQVPGIALLVQYLVPGIVFKSI